MKALPFPMTAHAGRTRKGATLVVVILSNGHRRRDILPNAPTIRRWLDDAQVADIMARIDRARGRPDTHGPDCFCPACDAIARG